MICSPFLVLGLRAKVVCMNYNCSKATRAPPRLCTMQPTFPHPPGTLPWGWAGQVCCRSPWLCRCWDSSVFFLKDSGIRGPHTQMHRSLLPAFLQSRRAHMCHLLDWPLVCALLHLHLHPGVPLLIHRTLPLLSAPVFLLSVCCLCTLLGFLVRLLARHAGICSHEHSRIH